MSRVDMDELDVDPYLQQCTWKGKVFTGVAVDIDPDTGALLLEYHYADGSLHGPMREWSEAGQLKVEEYHYQGLRHGPVRHWHDNGRIALEAAYRFQIVLSRKRWDEDGNLTESFLLTPDRRAYARLQRIRQDRGDPPVVTEASFR